MKQVEKDIQRLAEIINSWPLHMLDVSGSMDITSNMNDLMNINFLLDMPLESYNTFDLEQTIKACSKLRNHLVMFTNVGIRFNGIEDVITIIDKYEPLLKKKLTDIQKFIKNQDEEIN